MHFSPYFPLTTCIHFVNKAHHSSASGCRPKGVDLPFYRKEKFITGFSIVLLFGFFKGGGAPIRTNFPHFLTNLFKSNIFGLYVFKLKEARIFFVKNHTVAMATAAILENIGNFQIAKTFLPLGQ